MAYSQVDQLHKRCSIFTAPAVAAELLSAVGWNRHADLSNARLLEPSCGDGALLIPAAAELLAWARRSGATPDSLYDRIDAYEIHAATAQLARDNVCTLFEEFGYGSRLAASIANAWIKTADFMLSAGPDVTHVVANPPYVRWSRLPLGFQKRYASRGLPPADLSLLVMAQCTRRLVAGGLQSYLVPDRWLSSIHGRRVREEILTTCELVSTRHLEASTCFQQIVSTYPAVSVLRKRDSVDTKVSRRPTGAQLLDELRATHGVLKDASCVVGVGVALGNPDAFVRAKRPSVEGSRLRRLVTARDVRSETPNKSLHYVLTPWTRSGELVELRKFPRLQAQLKAFQQKLAARSCVRNAKDWHRTIDVISDRLRLEKLLIPAVGKDFKFRHDPTGELVPDNSLFWIQSAAWPISALLTLLDDGLLELACKLEAQRFGGGHRRLSAQFLNNLPLPKWDAIPNDLRIAVLNRNLPGDRGAITAAVFGIPLGRMNSALQ